MQLASCASHADPIGTLEMVKIQLDGCSHKDFIVFDFQAQEDR
jgi:hypothetical protein